LKKRVPSLEHGVLVHKIKIFLLIMKVHLKVVFHIFPLNKKFWKVLFFFVRKN
jgi:hypothetical protein